MSLNWEELLIGSGIGAIVGIGITKVCDSVLNFANRSSAQYIGDYFAYHFSTSGTGKIEGERCSIRRNFLGQVTAFLDCGRGDQALRYRGSVSLRAGFIYMHLIGVKHAEELFLVFTEPVTHKIGHSVGVIASISMDKKPYAGKFMLSSGELTDRKAVSLMGPDQGIVTEELPPP